MWSLVVQEIIAMLACRRTFFFWFFLSFLLPLACLSLSCLSCLRRICDKEREDLQTQKRERVGRKGKEGLR